MSGKKSGSQAVVRALRLLKLFSDNTPQLSIAEVVQKTGLNRTTVFRLLSALQTEGFIDRLPSGSYSLGGESMALGSYALRHNALWQAAHPVLLDLSAEVNERVTLEIPSPAPNGAVSMLVVDEIAGSHRIGVRNFVGEHLPIHATSTGKAVLAFLPEMERDAIFDQQFESLTENTLVERGVISAEIATINQQGYAIAFEELEEGLVACSVPIFNMQHMVCAAISIVGPTIRITKNRIQTSLLATLIEAGKQISKQLGYQVK